MMCGICQECGTLVYPITLNPSNPTDEMDKLAGRMVTHVTDRHPDLARKMMLFAFAASKVYAMTFLESKQEGFSPVRREWRKAVIDQIGAQAPAEAEAAEEAPAAAAGISEPAIGPGS